MVCFCCGRCTCADLQAGGQNQQAFNTVSPQEYKECQVTACQPHAGRIPPGNPYSSLCGVAGSQSTLCASFKSSLCRPMKVQGFQHVLQDARGASTGLPKLTSGGLGRSRAFNSQDARHAGKRQQDRTSGGLGRSRTFTVSWRIRTSSGDLFTVQPLERLLVRPHHVHDAATGRKLLKHASAWVASLMKSLKMLLTVSLCNATLKS